ncbi:MAG: hypothetical protein ACE5SW_09790 [Nitrososphaeraceae archaeon]
MSAGSSAVPNIVVQVKQQGFDQVNNSIQQFTKTSGLAVKTYFIQIYT